MSTAESATAHAHGTVEGNTGDRYAIQLSDATIIKCDP